jgi:hypothetical protein
MSLSDWLTLASSTAAMFATIISLLTLFELFKQRKASYKPDLCVLKRYFYVKVNGGFSDWHDDKLANFTNASIQLVNIGAGAAKGINAEWHFDLNGLIENINSLAKKHNQWLYIENKGHLLSIKSNDGSFCWVNAKMSTFRFEYLLTSSQDPHGSILTLPPSYSYLIPIYVRLWMQNKLNLNEIKAPTLELKLSYSDIGKSNHFSTHKVECCFQSFMSSETDYEFGVSLVEGS